MRNLKKTLYLSALALLSLFFAAAPALASTVTGATHRGDLRIKNVGSSTSYNPVPFTLSTDAMVDNSFINSALSNIAVTTLSGTDVAFMPAPPGADEWVVWVDTINQYSGLYYYLYTGGADMSGKLRYFPDDLGMSVADAASLEPGNNFALELSGFVNTSLVRGKLLAGKPASLSLHVSGAGAIKASIHGAVAAQVTQDTSNGYLEIDYDSWYGQVVTAPYDMWVTSVEPYCSAEADPPTFARIQLRGVETTVEGTVPNATVYTEATDADFNLPAVGSPAYYAFPLASPQFFAAGEQFAVVFKAFPNSGADDFRWYYWNDGVAGPYAGGDLCYTIGDPNASELWTAVPEWDMRFKINGTVPAKSVTGTGIASGEHTIIVTADTTDLKIYDGIAIKGTAALAGVSAPNTSYDWVFLKGGSVPYLDALTLDIAGVERGSWSYEYDTTFTDGSGNGNDATPTFRTTTTDLDLTAQLITFAPVAEAELVITQSTAGPPGIMTAAPPYATMPTATNPNAFTKLPGADVVQVVTEAGGIPTELVWYLIMMAVPVLLVFLVYGFTKDILATGIAVLLALAFFTAIGALNILASLLGGLMTVTVLVKRKAPVI